MTVSLLSLLQMTWCVKYFSIQLMTLNKLTSPVDKISVRNVLKNTQTLEPLMIKFVLSVVNLIFILCQTEKLDIKFLTCMFTVPINN